MKNRRFLVMATLAVFAAPPAAAAQRTLITDYTGLDCTINADDTFMYARPTLMSGIVAKLKDLTAIHIHGGKRIGKFVAFPNTDEEFAQIWFEVGTGGKRGWVQASHINCGG